MFSTVPVIENAARPLGRRGVFCLVKSEPRLVSALLLLTRSLRAPSLAVEEGVLAHWTLTEDGAVKTGGARMAASFSIGVRPLSAIEKRSWL